MVQSTTCVVQIINAKRARYSHEFVMLDQKHRRSAR